MMNTKLNKHQCAYCGAPLLGRSDKKYCNTQCRSSANNILKSEVEKPIISINKVLRKNRTILKTICPNGKATTRKEVLTQMGFKFNCFTSLFPTEHALYYLVYDFGFAPIYEYGKIKKVMIIQKQDYFTPFDPWKYVKR